MQLLSICSESFKSNQMWNHFPILVLYSRPKDFNTTAMMIDPEDLPSLAGNKREQNKKFIQKLKKRPPKDLEPQVHAIHEEVFEQIDCLACANCCKTIIHVQCRLLLPNNQTFSEKLIAAK